jgi:hypothetical protein
MEEKEDGLVSSLGLTVILYCVPENMTGTDKDDTEIDSQLQAAFCCENSVDPDLCPANHAKLWQKASPFG